MTKNRSFKSLVRARMKATGERYSTARAHVLAQRATSDQSRSTRPLPAGIVAVGGQQPDVAAAANLVSNSGGAGPDGRPLSEAMAFGLAGGVGFLYGAFEYDEGPTMTIVARSRSMPDPFCEPLFARAGATTAITTTTGAKKAAANLDQALQGGRSALCTVAAAGLPYVGLPADAAGMSPHLVGVVGADGDDLLIDDRAPEPLVVSREQFDAARSGYRQAKNRMITVERVDQNHDWPVALSEAVAACAAGFDTPPVPQFASNVGLAGLEKFSRLLVHPTDKKGWRRVFGDGRRAAIGLSRLHDCIEYAYTAPAAGRGLYAEFLEQSSAISGEQRWAEAAGLFRASAERWSEMAEAAVNADPNLDEYRRLGEQRAGQLDDVPDVQTMLEAGQQQRAVVDRCELSAIDAEQIFGTVHDLVDEVVNLERPALELLKG